MHQQEVPLVNVFLEGLKSDLEALTKTQTSSFADQAQKMIHTSAYVSCVLVKFAYFVMVVFLELTMLCFLGL